MSIKDITGNKYGRLTAIKYVENTKWGNAVWEFECECGNKKHLDAANVKSGSTKSCGCLKKEGGWGEGRRENPVYVIWTLMKQRCKNKNNKCYKYYGGRGIKVCDRWQKFENFVEDMGDRPEGMQVDRINNDGNYEPENCRWATRIENIRNSTVVKLNTEAVKVIKYALDNMDISMTRLAELHGVTLGAIGGIKYGKTWKDVNNK